MMPAHRKDNSSLPKLEVKNEPDENYGLNPMIKIRDVSSLKRAACCSTTSRQCGIQNCHLCQLVTQPHSSCSYVAAIEIDDHNTEQPLPPTIVKKEPNVEPFWISEFDQVADVVVVKDQPKEHKAYDRNKRMEVNPDNTITGKRKRTKTEKNRAEYLKQEPVPKTNKKPKRQTKKKMITKEEQALREKKSNERRLLLTTEVEKSMRKVRAKRIERNHRMAPEETRIVIKKQTAERRGIWSQEQGIRGTDRIRAAERRQNSTGNAGNYLEKQIAKKETVVSNAEDRFLSNLLERVEDERQRMSQVQPDKRKATINRTREKKRKIAEHLQEIVDYVFNTVMASRV